MSAIIASHPHRDHTNFHYSLTTTHQNKLAPGPVYVDNGTAAAAANWTRLEGWYPNPPLHLSVLDNPANDDTAQIPTFSQTARIGLMRSSTNATSVNQRKY